MGDLSIIARQLALKHIRSAVEAGLSEEHIRSTHHGSSRGEKFLENNPTARADGFGAYDVSIGGYYDYGADGRGRKFAPPQKIVVRRVCGMTVNMVFSLHELYEEIKKGQMALL